MKCIKCGAPLQKGVLFCRECGTKVLPRKKLFCRECGNKLASNDRFCKNCGAKVSVIDDLNEAVKAQTKATSKASSKTPPFISKTINKNTQKADNEAVHKTDSKANDQAGSVMQKGIDENNFFYRFVNFMGPGATKRYSQLQIIGISSLIGVGAIFFFMIMLAVALSGSSKTSEVSEEAEVVTHYTLPQGQSYAFMSDADDVYYARAVSDSLLKVEHWDKSFFGGFSYAEDIGTYDINDNENGFYWLDNSETAFGLIFKDLYNSELSSSDPRIFTINTRGEDDYNGTNYDENITCYSYQSDEYHLYRGIPLSNQSMKIECWSKTFSIGTFDPEYDWQVFNTDGNGLDFKWTDKDKSSFTITAKDSQNSTYWGSEKLVVFEKENRDAQFTSVRDYLDRIDTVQNDTPTVSDTQAEVTREIEPIEEESVAEDETATEEAASISASSQPQPDTEENIAVETQEDTVNSPEPVSSEVEKEEDTTQQIMDGKYTITALSATMYTTSTINVRGEPSQDGEKIGMLPADEKVEVTGQCNETNWYRIKFDGAEAYASNDYLTENAPQSGSAGATRSTEQKTDSGTETVASSVAPAVAATAGVTASSSSGQAYVLNKNPDSKKFHYPSCEKADRIAAHNRWDYTGTREEIIAMGYEPCKNCNP